MLAWGSKKIWPNLEQAQSCIGPQGVIRISRPLLRLTHLLGPRHVVVFFLRVSCLLRSLRCSLFRVTRNSPRDCGKEPSVHWLMQVVLGLLLHDIRVLAHIAGIDISCRPLPSRLQTSCTIETFFSYFTCPWHLWSQLVPILRVLCWAGSISPYHFENVFSADNTLGGLSANFSAKMGSGFG